MTASTHFLRDILRQPQEMERTLEYLTGPGRAALQQGSCLIRSAKNVFITGIGASWHAAISAGSLLHRAGNPVHLQEAGELLHVTSIPRGSIIVAISRTGRSIEIVQLLAKAEASGATVIGITNSPDSPLARQSRITIAVPIRLDHAISVNTYSTLLIAAGALAVESTTGFDAVARSLFQATRDATPCLDVWQLQLEESEWLADGVPYCFVARGGSLGTCQEAQLLWQEAAKMPATAMSTSGFRHGPQEMVRKGMRFCMWIDQAEMREQDLSVARDLMELGASVMVIGEKLSSDAGDLVLELPSTPLHWQSVIDVFPVQLAAERLSRLTGVDCDSFRVCSYVVEEEHGLLRKKTGEPRNAD